MGGQAEEAEAGPRWKQTCKSQERPSPRSRGRELREVLGGGLGVLRWEGMGPRGEHRDGGIRQGTHTPPRLTRTGLDGTPSHYPGGCRGPRGHLALSPDPFRQHENEGGGEGPAVGLCSPCSQSWAPPTPGSSAQNLLLPSVPDLRPRQDLTAPAGPPRPGKWGTAMLTSGLVTTESPSPTSWR